MIGGVIEIDLATADDLAEDQARTDRAKLWVLNELPEGARVVVRLGSRQFLYDDALDLLRRNGDRLFIELVGEHYLQVRDLVRSARAGARSSW